MVKVSKGSGRCGCGGGCGGDVTEGILLVAAVMLQRGVERWLLRVEVIAVVRVGKAIIVYVMVIVLVKVVILVV